MVRVSLFALAFLALPALASAERPDPAHGLWLTENRNAIVEIAPCGEEICGRTVWVANPVDEAGRPKRDESNPDRTKRARPICGIELVGGLRRTDTGEWQQGWVYNPRDGGTYSAELRAVSPTELEVRGYVGVSFLGKSQRWTRVESDRGGCATS